MTTVARATVFVNASSGWDPKEEAPEKLRQMFKSAGINANIEYVAAGVNLAEKSREAVAAGSDFVVAGGGDGTLSATASGLVGTKTIFGVLPLGTLNHFARDLNIPLDLEAAAQVVVGGKTVEVDVAEVNGKTFLNNSIIGLYPIFRFLRKEQEKRWGKNKLAFLMAVWSVLRRYPFLNVRLIANGEEIPRKTPYILVGNNRHNMEGYNLGFRDSLTEGKLWIYVMKEQSRTALIRMLVRLAFGRFRGEHGFEIFPAEELYVEAKRGKRIGVALDGEVMVMETPLRYRILPRSLWVRVPRVE